MYADDLRRHHRWQVGGICDGDLTTVMSDQRVVTAYDVDDVAVEQDAAGFAQGHGSPSVERLSRASSGRFSPQPAGRGQPVCRT